MSVTRPTTSESEFFFGILRITTAQVLRAAGIDRCAPSVLDTMTDILQRQMTLLAERCRERAELSGRSQIELADLAETMQSVGMIHPYASVDNSDGWELLGLEQELKGLEQEKRKIEQEVRKAGRDKEELKRLERRLKEVRRRGEYTTFRIEQIERDGGVAGFIKFVDWAKSETAAVERFVAQGETGRKEEEEEEDDDDENETETDKRKRKKREEEWLYKMMKKQTRVGHENRFIQTVLSPVPSGGLGVGTEETYGFKAPAKKTRVE